MSAEGLAGALISPIIDALAGIVRQHGEARAREEAARVAAMLAEPLATPRPIDEVIAEARRPVDPATERLFNRWSPAMAALAGAPLAVYVAGSSSERSRVHAAMDSVRDAGLELTLDWLAAIDRVGAASPTDPAVRADAARADLDAIDRADVVWLLAPHPGSTSTGAWTELGYALAKGKRVVVSGDATRSIFVSGAEAEVATDGDALALLRRKAIPMPTRLDSEGEP